MDRGERLTSRTKTAIKNALAELMREQNYPEITVSNIVDRGNIGRSTFYRHYQSKADVLVDRHRDTFDYLFSSLASADDWLSVEPPPEWVAFLEKHQKQGGNHFSWKYKLGNDLDYLFNNINMLLTSTVENKLRNSFSEEESSIPLPILAQSISTSFSGLIISWFTKFQSFDPSRFATYLHRIMGSIVREAVGKDNR